jgi:site-specific DNA recombinase
MTGGSTIKALSYCRVSTDEQARSGFSLAQQREALRAHCKYNSIEIVAEFEDKYSGATLDRPGLDTLRDVVSSGGIDLVLCQDRDRISREPAHVYLLREEFVAHGTALRSLSDRGDDSPEGELADAILDQLAKFERAKTMERTRRGKIRKAQEGKVVGSGKAPYGFRYADNHYHVDPERMPYAREIFEMAAAKHSLYSIAQRLTKMGAPTPGGGKWHTSTIRKIILNDTYTGTFWWGKVRVIPTTVSEVQNGERIYKRKVRMEKRPRSEWIAIPVPPSGIPPETVARARESLDGNTMVVSKNSGRVWELSGGVAVCSECGKQMQAYSTTNSAGTRYHYYRCSKRPLHACSNRKHYRAGELETKVNEAIVASFHPETWEGFVNDFCDIKLAKIQNLYRRNPQEAKENMAKRVVALQTKISRARELFIDGDLSRSDYDEKKATLQDEIELVQEELTKIDNLDDEVGRVEALRHTLLSIENPLSGHYAFLSDEDNAEAVGESKDDLLPYGLGYGSKKTAAWRRQEFYRQVGIVVAVGEELEIRLGTAGDLVSKVITTSARGGV